MSTLLPTKNEQPSAYEVMSLQIILASLVPTAGILLVGAFGTLRMDATSILVFTVFFLICAIVTFIAERKILKLVQAGTLKPYKDFTTACKEQLKGNTKPIIAPIGGREVEELANIFNVLLDKQAKLVQQRMTPPPPPPQAVVVHQPATNNEAAILNKQLTQLLSELTPIVNGDLRVKTSVPKGYVGVVADTCNSFIEELAQFVRWTRYASQEVISSSQSILDRSIEMTKTIEVQMLSLSQTTNSVEEIVAFVQRLGNTLQLSVDVAREIQTHLQQEDDDSQNFATPLSQLTREAEQQTTLLEDVLSSTAATSIRAESLIGELYNVAQHLHTSSVDILRTAERINDLEQLAQRWSNAAEAFTIAEPEENGKAQDPWLL